MLTGDHRDLGLRLTGFHSRPLSALETAGPVSFHEA